MPNDPNNIPKKTNEKRSFYIALSVCLLAAVAAAWSTYAGVMDYVKSSRPAAVSSTVTVQSADVSSKKPESTPAPSKQEEASPAVSAAAEVSEDAVPAAAYTASNTFLPPVAGEVIASYSGDALVYNKTMRDWRTHPGSDFACSDGEEILACANGIVTRTYTDALWGNVVEVEHGEYTLRYCGVGENFAVGVGDVLQQGQVLGHATAVPCEALLAVHVHVEATCGGEKIDPASLFA